MPLSFVLVCSCYSCAWNPSKERAARCTHRACCYFNDILRIPFINFVADFWMSGDDTYFRSSLIFLWLAVVCSCLLLSAFACCCLLLYTCHLLLSAAACCCLYCTCADASLETRLMFLPAVAAAITKYFGVLLLVMVCQLLKSAICLVCCCCRS